ncbi:MAG: FMN-binding protein [Oscillospiraceae bacterium]|nr:FMN-binding protein [Oscillospiraceae bacterium]
MKLLKTYVILIVIVAIFAGAMFALNLHTGPIIEKNNAGAANDKLNAVMPGGSGYEDITATLTARPASVTTVYKETSGLGFVMLCTAESSYSTAPMEITLGIAADGKISGVEITAYNDTASFDFRTKDPSYLASYVGQDSALADVGLVAGSTFSSTAFRNSIVAAMEVMTANNLIAAGVKGDDQILTELIPTVAPGFTKLAEAEGTGNIQKVFTAENGTGFAYIVNSGDATVLAIVNAMGVCKVYDVEGADITANAADVVAEAVAHASATPNKFTDDLTTKVGRMMEGAADITPIALDTFNTVVSAVSFTVDGTTYYAFYSRSIGFHQMDVFFVIDENGAITKMDAKQFIFDEEYFMAFGGMDVTAYKDGFVGITGDTFTGDEVIIATATMTSNAIKESTQDVFTAFNALKGGAQ